MAKNGKSERGNGEQASRTRVDSKEQVEWESQRRHRLGVPALAGGVLYLLGAVIISSALSGAPSVGSLQALAPALRGEASPTVSPRAPEVRYISHHAFALIAGSVLTALSLLILAATLMLLIRATRFRRPESWQATAPLVLIGGIGYAVAAVVHQVAGAILSHKFAVGHDFSNKAVDEALSTAGVTIGAQYLALITGLCLMVGMISAALGGMRAGLITRWLGVVGIFAALLIFLPIGGETLAIVPAFWLAAMGLLYMGRWPGEEPPAWAAGEARPWPSQAEMRARQKAGGNGAAPAGASAAPAADGASAGPVPQLASGGGGARRRRKRGARR